MADFFGENELNFVAADCHGTVTCLVCQAKVSYQNVMNHWKKKIHADDPEPTPAQIGHWLSHKDRGTPYRQ